MSDVIGAGDGRTAQWTAVENLSYEQARAELEEIVRILELGQMGLEESLVYWERGETLAKACERHLDGAAARVEAVLGAQTAPVAADAADTDSEEAF